MGSSKVLGRRIFTPIRTYVFYFRNPVSEILTSNKVSTSLYKDRMWEFI